MDYYKLCQEVSYTKEISKHFFVTRRAVEMTRAILFELSHRVVIDRAVDTAI